MSKSKLYTELAFESCPLFCQITAMGEDFSIAVYGGELPHVGSVVMAQARPSLTGEGISATSSVINSAGHKDEIIARKFAETVAIRKNCTAVCACGIHMDHVTCEQLGLIREGSKRLLEKCLTNME